ncbi:MAG: hypothetical protein R3B13_19525 [Polyangiaceae bacterium]
MRRLFSGFFALGAVATLSASGCADNESALFVRAVVKLESGQCVATPDPSTTFFSSGVLDLAFRDSYSASLLVGNQLVNRGSKDLLRTETSRIVLRGAEVRLLNDQQALIREFTVPVSGFVDPGTGDEPGYGVTGALLIPSGLALAAGTRVVADVRVFGDTLGGEEVTSDSLSFPITLCNGCLISYPLDADDPAQPGYQCVSGTDVSSQDSPCRVGQDEAVDCRLCGNLPICQVPP